MRFEIVAWPERIGVPLLRPISLFDMPEDRSKAEGAAGGVPDFAVEEMTKLLHAAVAKRVAGTGPPRRFINGAGRDGADGCSRDGSHAADDGARALEGGVAETGAAVCVLFSGGIDSTVLAALAHAHVPEADPIDLVNVCFDPCEAPDRCPPTKSWPSAWYLI